MKLGRLFLYLAGNLTHYKNEGEQIYNDKVKKWRDKISFWAKDNDIDYFDPAITFEKELAHDFSGKSVVEQNKHFLHKSDLLIVDLSNLDKSFGTIFEIVYAHTKLGKPVIAFGECEQYDYSPHLNACITERFNDFSGAMEYINVVYL